MNSKNQNLIKNKDQILYYLNKLDLNDLVYFVEFHYGNNILPGKKRRLFEQLKILISSKKTKLTISHDIAKNLHLLNFVRMLDIDRKNYYNIQDNKENFIKFEKYRQKRKKYLNKNIAIKKNLEIIQKEHLHQTQKLNEYKRVRKIKLLWLIDNYEQLLDDKSLSSLTKFSDTQILDLRKNLAQENNLRSSKSYKKLDKNKLFLEEKFINSQIRDTETRNRNRGGKDSNHVEETYLDVLKKGANLYES